MDHAAVQALRPYSGGSPRIEADIATADGRFRLSKQFYAGRYAKVTDLASGRLIAQADEAEAFIGDLVRGGASGPAGLLWVRQGLTGLERQSKSDERSETEARAGILTSVQGEVEELTGGRCMQVAMKACDEELMRLVTPKSGKPKADGPYEKAILERDALAAEEQRLGAEVQQMREALDARRDARKRLAELERPEDAERRRKNVEDAQAALDAARSHRQELTAAETEAELLGSRYEEARHALESYRTSLTRAAELAKLHADAARRREEASRRQSDAHAQAEAAAKAMEVAEMEERESSALLKRLENAMRAREAAERRKGVAGALEKAEAARREIEEGEARLRTLEVPAPVLEELETVEGELTGLRAATTARLPSVTFNQAAGVEAAISIDGKPMADGEEYPLNATTELRITDLGTLTIAPKLHDSAMKELAEAERRRAELLEALGVTTFAEARRRDAERRRKANDLELARQRLAMVAPEGIDALRAELARLESDRAGEQEIEGDPEEARAAFEEAGMRVVQSRNAVREHRPAVERADAAMMEAERALAAIAGERDRLAEDLGPEEKRSGREADLAERAAQTEAALAPLQEKLADMRAASPDLASAEAALARARSVAESATKEAAMLREKVADLNGRIAARSDEALEEAWRETADRRAEADATVARFDHEVALLRRLRSALEESRTAARDHYFKPVLRELHPLMGLLFDDADIVFDEATLLPQTVRRDGQVEDVDRLSGGMREQLAVLTRLAFARLLAQDGQPTPVILDDALVYSDDDRIEKMFDALHRQGRDQQIIVFSCRQRAFSDLGGNMLSLQGWSPEG